MAIKIEYPLLPDRDRKKAFMDSLIPESPLKSLGIPMPVCRDIAKNLSSDDIEIRYIEDALGDLLSTLSHIAVRLRMELLLTQDT